MSVIYVSPEMKDNPTASFISINNDFTLLKPGKPGQLLRGPRRVVRLCVFSLLVPAVLITVPLYVRLVLYPPTHHPMMPTDQRLLARHASSFWCQAQSTHMNGSYTSYLTKGKPDVRPDRRTYVMLNHIQARDDIKEYWGFYLLRGSTVSISSCTRWEGGQLMILRGLENLHRCAWIGEMDSNEDMAEDDDIASNERHRLQNLEKARRPNVSQVAEDYINPEDSIGAEATTVLPMQSHERREGITKLLRQAIQMSKNKKEILRIIHSEGKKQKSDRIKDNSSSKNYTTTTDKVETQEDTVISNTDNGTESVQKIPVEQLVITTQATPRQQKKAGRRLKDDTLRGEKRKQNRRRRKKKGDDRVRNLTEEDALPRSRQRREAAGEEEEDGAFEEQDVEETDNILGILRGGKISDTPAEEKSVGTQVFFPEGLRFERGKFNQSTANDRSQEEHVSSYSSSEEALAKCEGVILNLPLVASRRCSFKGMELNRISYDIPITGTYYFVFSSDNEIYTNDIFFNLTMERVVYNVTKSEEMCTNATDCVMPLTFWSDDQAVVEVPADGSWDHSYVLDIKCEPRVYVYLSMLLLVPLFIIFCAFN